MQILDGETGAILPPAAVGHGSRSHALQVVFIPAVNSSSSVLTVLLKLF